MTIARSIFGAIMLATGGIGLHAVGAPPSAAIVNIALEPVGPDALAIAAEVVAIADVEGMAEVKVIRRGVAGESVSVQSQSFSLSAGETTVVARLTLSFSEEDRLEVEAKLTSGDQIISTATVTSGAAR